MSARSERIAAIAAEVEHRARACAREGGPVIATMMRGLAKDMRSGGVTADVVAHFDGIPTEALLSLRLACGLHRAALDGRAPALRPFLPSVGGAFDPARDEAALEAATVATVPEERGVLEDYLQGFPQTNDVGRSVGLMCGFLQVAAETGMPLDLMEIGTSAGLNLCFDKFRFQLGDHAWGDPASGVLLTPRWEGPPPRLDARLSIRRRTGADLSPIDVCEPGTPLRLASYIWPDQPERARRLLAAIDIARRTERRLDRASADEWLTKHLPEATPGVARVVFNSAMWSYMPGAVQDAVTAAIEDAGARATAETPLAWVSLEPGVDVHPPSCEIALTSWPGGQRRVLGLAHTHGYWVRWTG